MKEIDLAAIQQHREDYVHRHYAQFACCSAHASADDVPALLAEVARLRAVPVRLEVWAAQELTRVRMERDQARHQLTTVTVERDVLTEELTGAKSSISHMARAMSWISGHDRQGLDHLADAMREVRNRESTVIQAKRQADRARFAEARVAELEAEVEIWKERSWKKET